MRKQTAYNKKMGIRLCGALIFVLMILGFLLAFIPTRMSSAHTNKIVSLYFNETGYSMDAFEQVYGVGEKTVLISEDEYDIPVYHYLSEESVNEKVIILVHWHESNHKAMYPLTEEFLKRGYDVVLYDQRSHGENTAKTVSFGLWESNDLKQVVQYVIEKYDYKKISILGQSMGASTVAYYSGTEHAKKNVDCVIIDSAYTAMNEEVSWEITKMNHSLLGKMLAQYGSIFSKMINGFGFEDVNIVKKIESNQIPTMIIHSKADMKCPFYMGQNLYESIGHWEKKFEIYDESEHLFAYWDETERYMDSIVSFMEGSQ